MSRRRDQGSHAQRIVAALLVSLWAFALIGASWHGAHDAHRFCSEHGAFEEAGVGVGGAAPDDGGSQAQTPASQAEGHETCAFTALALHSTFVGHQAVAISAAPVTEAPRLPMLGIEVAAPIDLLSIAPKGSPPVVA